MGSVAIAAEVVPCALKSIHERPCVKSSAEVGGTPRIDLTRDASGDGSDPPQLRHWALLEIEVFERQQDPGVVKVERLDISRERDSLEVAFSTRGDGSLARGCVGRNLSLVHTAMLLAFAA